MPQRRQTARAFDDPAAGDESLSVAYVTQSEITAVTEEFLNRHVDRLDMQLVFNPSNASEFILKLETIQAQISEEEQQSHVAYDLIVLDLQVNLYDGLTDIIENVGLDFEKIMLICATDEGTLNDLIAQVPTEGRDEGYNYRAIINVSDFKSAIFIDYLQGTAGKIAARYEGQTVNIILDYKFYDYYYLLYDISFINFLEGVLRGKGINDYRLFFQTESKFPTFLDYSRGDIITLDAASFAAYCDGAICAMSVYSFSSLFSFFQDMGNIKEDFFVYGVIDNLLLGSSNPIEVSFSWSVGGYGNRSARRKTAQRPSTFSDAIEQYHEFIGEKMLECIEGEHVYFLTPEDFFDYSF